ncbi:DNA/RNA helicase domain-containing protein [Loigolactobacillus coryniformis]|uniref:DNA/RNA helicase domain-containing protein n=1 Tax=Loigolactobacillus coryniformis TaxID=1610 RepID=UPI003F51B255
MIPFTIREFLSLSVSEKLLTDAFGYHRMNPKPIEIKDFILFSKLFVDELESDQDVDGWYLGTDLQVIADFDVLWYGKKLILNLDLKDRRNEHMDSSVIDKFKKQSRVIRLVPTYKVINVTFVASERKLFVLKDDNLSEITFDYLAELLSAFITNEKPHNLIGELKSSDYIVSPLTDVEKFLTGKYWLTEDQEIIKQKCMQKGIYAVRGDAGSGKSLIAYDLASKLNINQKVLFVFAGTLRIAHRKLGEALQNITFIGAKTLNDIDLDQYDCVILDEAQRLYNNQRKKVVMWAEQNFKTHTIIFFYDVDQALSPKDAGNLMNSIVESFERRRIGERFFLHKGLRSNPSIHAFVRQLRFLGKRPPMDVGIENILAAVEVRYFSTAADAMSWIHQQIENGYKFIVPTPSSYNKSSSDSFRSMQNEYSNTHDVIGGEFNNVVTYIDDQVHYTNDGHLEGSNTEYYQIRNEVYVNMSRAKSHLALAIINNIDVYQAITEVIFGSRADS